MKFKKKTKNEKKYKQKIYRKNQIRKNNENIFQQFSTQQKTTKKCQNIQQCQKNDKSQSYKNNLHGISQIIFTAKM